MTTDSYMISALAERRYSSETDTPPAMVIN